jgi:hypothetical protein
MPSIEFLGYQSLLNCYANIFKILKFFRPHISIFPSLIPEKHLYIIMLTRLKIT